MIGFATRGRYLARFLPTFAAAALVLATAHAQPPAPAIPAHFTLKNGMEVVVIPDHRTPVVTQMVWYRVGSADETPGKSGLAHFLEHLMFKGTKRHPAGEFSKVVTLIGGNENAFTYFDYTGYYQRVPREKLQTIMAFEADRMTGLVLTDKVALPERDVVLEEYNQRIANSPEARLNEQMMAALYVNHPYGRPVIGWKPEIEKLNREDALAFYKRFYAPNNAILVIAGDVDADHVRALAETTYGKIPALPGIAAKRIRPQEPAPIAARSVTLADPQVRQRLMRRIYLVPSATSAAPGESEALEVLAQVIGGGSNSTLYQNLVVKGGLAINAGAQYQSSGLDPTQFGISVVPKPDIPFAKVEDAVDEILSDVVDHGVSDDDMERAKTQLIAQATYARDNQTTLARWYGTALTTGQTVEDVARWPGRIRGVTSDAVREAARKWLEAKRSVTGYLVREEPQKPVRREDKRS